MDDNQKAARAHLINMAQNPKNPPITILGAAVAFLQHCGVTEFERKLALKVDALIRDEAMAAIKQNESMAKANQVIEHRPARDDGKLV